MRPATIAGHGKRMDNKMADYIIHNPSVHMDQTYEDLGEMIKNVGAKASFYSETVKIFNTDYFYQEKHGDRPYVKLFMRNIWMPFAPAFVRDWTGDRWTSEFKLTPEEIWFEEHNRGDWVNFRNHPNFSFTHIWFIDKPDKLTFMYNGEKTDFIPERHHVVTIPSSVYYKTTSNEEYEDRRMIIVNSKIVK